jgi:hypothetical protein
MNAGRTTWAVVIAGLAGVAAAWANSDAVLDRYTSIPQRNAFALKPAPPPPEPVRPVAPPPAITLKLTAIISLAPTKKAILLVSQPGKPPESKVLAENQLESGVEVKDINAEAGTVKVMVNGEETDLNFDKDGIKPTFTAAASAGPVAGVAPVSATSLFANAANGKATPPIGAASGNSLSSFLKQASSAASSGAGTLAPIATHGYGGYGGGVGGMPSPISGQAFRFDGNAATAAPQPKWPPEQQVSQEQSIIHMEILRELQRSGKMSLPPLPPTVMSQPQEPPGPPMAP